MLRSTFSNIEHQSIEVVVDSITPWALRCEQEADYKFFGQNRQGFFTKMDLKGLLRGDFPARDALQTLLLAPLVVPALVIGLAILLAFSGLGIRDVGTRLDDLFVTFEIAFDVIMPKGPLEAAFGR